MNASAQAGRALSRPAGDGRAAAPVGLVHLGLGNFFRAHQAWYTDHAPDAADWGIAAFTGRGGALAESLTAQDGLYTLITQAPDGNRFEVLGSLSRAHAAADHPAWLGYLASPDVRAVTITVTEAGYVRGPDGGLDRDRDDVRADLAALRADPTALVRTAPARLAAGCAARRRADAGPLTLVPSARRSPAASARNAASSSPESVHSWAVRCFSSVATCCSPSRVCSSSASAWRCSTP